VPTAPALRNVLGRPRSDEKTKKRASARSQEPRESAQVEYGISGTRPRLEKARGLGARAVFNSQKTDTVEFLKIHHGEVNQAMP
jgi:hypothetical protein